MGSGGPRRGCRFPQTHPQGHSTRAYQRILPKFDRPSEDEQKEPLPNPGCFPVSHSSRISVLCSLVLNHHPSPIHIFSQLAMFYPLVPGLNPFPCQIVNPDRFHINQSWFLLFVNLHFPESVQATPNPFSLSPSLIPQSSFKMPSHSAQIKDEFSSQWTLYPICNNITE